MLSTEDEQLFEEALDTLGFVCDYLSQDSAAFAAVPPRIDNYRVLVPLVACACPRPGALWLAEEMAKQVPKMLFHLNGSISATGISMASMLINISVRPTAGGLALVVTSRACCPARAALSSSIVARFR